MGLLPGVADRNQDFRDALELDPGNANLSSLPNGPQLPLDVAASVQAPAHSDRAEVWQTPVSKPGS